MRPLAPILISLLAACRTDSEDDRIDTTSSTWNCDTGRVTDTRILAAEEAAAYTGDDGVMDDAECLAACIAIIGWGGEECISYVQNADGSIELSCESDQICEGRRFAGLRRARSSVRLLGRGGVRPPATPPSAEDAVAGAWLARAAHAEAASVTAFRRLAAELRLHAAPTALVDAALAAAHDEVRHARTTRRLARARGGTAPRVRGAPARRRSLVALALENAVEGCVNETWAALVALHQSLEAPDADVREALAEIARDEVRHAELARAVDAWVRPLLTPPERARVERARRKAVSAVAAARYPSVLGLPDAARVQALHAAMTRAVWG